MDIKDQRAACVRFEGGKYISNAFHSPEGDWWLFPDGRTMLIANYHPDLGDPVSREQANELLHKVYESVFQIEISLYGYPASILIYPNAGDTVFEGIGKWWNSALVAAVAELAERDKK